MGEGVYVFSFSPESPHLIPLLTKLSPSRTLATAVRSSLPASVFRTYPRAPEFKAARTVVLSLF